MVQELIQEPNDYNSVHVITILFLLLRWGGGGGLGELGAAARWKFQCGRLTHVLFILYTAITPRSPFESSSPGVTTAG